MNNSEYTTNTIQRRKYRVLLFVLFAVVWQSFFVLSGSDTIRFLRFKSWKPSCPNSGIPKKYFRRLSRFSGISVCQGFYRQLLSELPSQSQALPIKECSVIRLYRRIFSAYLPALVLVLHLRS